MVTNPLTTTLNVFGLFRNYLFHPSYDPDSAIDPGDLSNLGTSHTSPPSLSGTQQDEPRTSLAILQYVSMEVNEVGEHWKSVEVRRRS
jgi:hypothetical protein